MNSQEKAPVVGALRGIKDSLLRETIHSGIYNTPSSNEIPRHAERHFY